MANESYHIDKINNELDAARRAALEGNNGKARVCARRAAGAAISWHASKHAAAAWADDTMGQLKQLGTLTDVPQEIRDAASRLVARISDNFQYPFSTDPVTDGRRIAEYFIRLMNADHHR